MASGPSGPVRRGVAVHCSLGLPGISQSEVKIDQLNVHETLDKMSFRATLSVSSNPSRSEPWRNS